MIRLEKLRAGYPGNEILRAADLAIPDGELTIIIGPNGSGKSTLMKTMAGILPKMGGEVLLDTSRELKDISAFSNEARARLISYLPQNRNTPEITAFRMVLHGRFPYLGWPRKYRKCDEDAAGRAMREADCWDLRARKMPDLSGGERQKVYIAMIFAQDTPNILLDEPTTWLDIGHQLELMKTAKALAAKHHAVVMVLHDLGLAMRFADRLILTAEGKTTAPLSPDQLFESRLADKAFGIRLSRFMTDDGWQYFCR